MDLPGLAIDIILDLLLNLCFQFVAAAIDDLNSVVIEWLWLAEIMIPQSNPSVRTT